MKIKKNDTVEVITGKNRGKRGKVIRAYPETNRLLIEGVNILKKHERANQKNQQGGITEKEHSVDASNVMLVDPKKGTRTRIGKRAVTSPTGVVRMERYAKKSGDAVA